MSEEDENKNRPSGLTHTLVTFEEWPSKVETHEEDDRSHIFIVKIGDRISFLEMAIERTAKGDYIISQQAYATEILKGYISTSKGETPRSPANRNTSRNNPKSQPFDPATYRSVIGVES